MVSLSYIAPLTLVDGLPCDCLSVLDRGLIYGVGFFDVMFVSD